MQVKLIKISTILFFVLFINKISYSTDIKTNTFKTDSLIQQNNLQLFKEIPNGKSKILDLSKFSKIKINKQKVTALILDILCGVVGGHRMALGTKPIVPIFYAITIGGGFFLLPAIDFFVILFTKDISKYQNNDKIIMWLD